MDKRTELEIQRDKYEAVIEERDALIHSLRGENEKLREEFFDILVKWCFGSRHVLKGITDVGGLLNDIMLWLMVKPYRCKTKSVRRLSANRGICFMYIKVM